MLQVIPKMHTSTITTKGQVTIPIDYRKQLSLKPGGRVAFLQEAGQLVIKPITKDITAVFGLVKAKRHVSIAQMEEAVRKRAAECLKQR